MPPVSGSELEPGAQLANTIDAIDTSHVAEGAVADAFRKKNALCERKER
jgi:hypothetical protein